MKRALIGFLYFVPIIVYTSYIGHQGYVALTSHGLGEFYPRLVITLLLVGMIASTVAGFTGRPAIAACAGIVILVSSFLPFFAERLYGLPLGSIYHSIPIVGGIVLTTAIVTHISKALSMLRIFYFIPVAAYAAFIVLSFLESSRYMTHPHFLLYYFLVPLAGRLVVAGSTVAGFVYCLPATDTDTSSASAGRQRLFSIGLVVALCFALLSPVLIIEIARETARGRVARERDFSALLTHGTPQQVKEAIEAGMDVNAHFGGSHGRPALFSAAANENPEVLNTLLEAGAYINIRNLRGALTRDETALMVAVRLGNLKNISVLINAGIDINAQERTFGSTALMMAPDSTVMAALIEADADVNVQDTLGRTALIRAVGRNRSQLDVISILLEAGTDINAQDERGRTALMHAVENNHLDVIPLLLEAGADVNVQADLGRTALMYANPDIISLLLEAGADVNVQAGGSRTALVNAVESNHHLDVISLLLEAGADVNARFSVGKTAIMVVHRNADSRLFCVLIEAGADVNAQDNLGRTVLMHAVARNHHFDVISLLLEAGADINAQSLTGSSTTDGTTALSLAAIHNPEIIAALLEAGADVNVGNSALIRIVRLHADSRLIAGMLLDAGADINAQDSSGSTALVNAVQRNRHLDVISLLLEAGADVEVPSNSGRTALMYAVEKNRSPEIISLLREAGAK